MEAGPKTVAKHASLLQAVPRPGGTEVVPRAYRGRAAEGCKYRIMWGRVPRRYRNGSKECFKTFDLIGSGTQAELRHDRRRLQYMRSCARWCRDDSEAGPQNAAICRILWEAVHWLDHRVLQDVRCCGDLWGAVLRCTWENHP